jgi:hypothetical protein
MADRSQRLVSILVCMRQRSGVRFVRLGSRYDPGWVGRDRDDRRGSPAIAPLGDGYVHEIGAGLVCSLDGPAATPPPLPLSSQSCATRPFDAVAGTGVRSACDLCRVACRTHDRTSSHTGTALSPILRARPCQLDATDRGLPAMGKLESPELPEHPLVSYAWPVCSTHASSPPPRHFADPEEAPRPPLRPVTAWHGLLSCLRAIPL